MKTIDLTGRKFDAELARWLSAQIQLDLGIDRDHDGCTVEMSLPMLAAWENTGIHNTSIVRAIQGSKLPPKTFSGMPLECKRSIPSDEIRIFRNGEEIVRVIGIGI